LHIFAESNVDNYNKIKLASQNFKRLIISLLTLVVLASLCATSGI